MSLRSCIKCQKKYEDNHAECPHCGTPHNPGAEKLGYVAFAIVGILFILPDAAFYFKNSRLPGSIDEFIGAFGLLF
ncbi:MAG: hypothetical protein JKY92_05315 [Magnetovibrio sp.]|nr:hypothetical protein [Magnetovibrio sp.]